MDVCPACGSIERTSPEFGLWQCENLVNRPYSVETPDQNIVLAPNAYGRRVETVDNWVTCGTRYPDTTPYTTWPTQTCQCGLFAVGICAQCHRPVCGPHGQLVDGALKCLDCRNAAVRAWKALAAEKARAANDERQQVAAAEQRALDALREQARSRGEPLDLDSAGAALFSGVFDALEAAGFPGAERVPAGLSTRRKQKVNAWLTGYHLWQGMAAQKYSTDWTGPTESAPDFYLTTDGKVVSKTDRLGGGWGGSRSILVRHVTLTAVIKLAWRCSSGSRPPIVICGSRCRGC